MTIPRELLALYHGLSEKEIFYLKARWFVSPIDAVERAIPVKGKIYDIGCGVGLLSNLAALRSPDRNIVGVDLSEEKIAVARKSIGDRNNIVFKNADALNLSLENADAATICDTLHHIPTEYQEQLLRYLYKSLDHGGLLLIQDIDKEPFYKYAFARCVDMALNRLEPVYYRASSDWVRLLNNIGFEVTAERLDKGYPIAAVLFKCTKK